MITSEDPNILAADLSRMTVNPVSIERAEEILAEELVWLPEGEPRQCIAEDCTWDLGGPGRPHKVRRRTILSRRPADQLRIVVEVALVGPTAIELERRRFEQPSGDVERYTSELRARTISDSAQ